ncbi:MAG: MBL fold metallo-hydrolase [Cyclobacteriaceae bacterium]|nr:MBL fold metallo-hydrolase [Cyclobacteriaceae bacterium]
MNVRVRFFGAAGTVTGSKFLLEIDDFNILVDCGLFQGLKELRLLNWEPFPVDPAGIHAVVLTHAHIDHTGYLPRLVKEGFSGPIYCTEPSYELLKILLLDSAKLQEEEANFARKKGYSKHENPQPLYNTIDVQSVFPLVKPLSFHENFKINERVHLNFLHAGHILGAAIAELTIQGMYQEKKIVFSGDLGRYNDPILYPPEHAKTADILFVESTYGDKKNPMTHPMEAFADLINRSVKREGCLLIPAFSVGRTQLLIYYMKELIESKQVPDIPVYIDSPMAISVTDLYKRFFDEHKLEEADLHNHHAVFDYKNIHYKHAQEESMELNYIKKNAIIISASGMCTGGRIMHHLYNRLQRSNDTLLFVGYQAEGTRGRRIADGEKTIKMFGLDVPVECHVEKMDGLSAHADVDELFTWLSGFEESPKMTFCVHGEKAVATRFAERINADLGWNARVPEMNESVDLFRGI